MTATSQAESLAPGVYAGMPSAEYFAAPGLSNSGMKDLAVSPLRYWHLHINPDRPTIKPTPEMQFGTALHTAVLETEEFDKRYACEIDAEDFEDCLVTIDDLRTWLKDKGFTPKGTRKAEIVAQVQHHAHLLSVPANIFDVLQADFEVGSVGKTILSKYDWRRCMGAAVALRREPMIQRLLEQGQAEVSVFANDPETGVPLKARMDWVTSHKILDLKTFCQMRGKSIDKSVTDAIYYENYLRQGYFYCLLDSIGVPTSRPFVLAFVESEEPHEVRIRELRPKTGPNATLYWTRSMLDVKRLIHTYADYYKRFGTDMWRDDRDVEPLMDEEIPQLSY